MDQRVTVSAEFLEQIVSIADPEGGCDRCPNVSNRPADGYEGCGLEVCMSVIKDEIEKVLRGQN